MSAGRKESLNPSVTCPRSHCLPGLPASGGVQIPSPPPRLRTAAKPRSREAANLQRRAPLVNSRCALRGRLQSSWPRGHLRETAAAGTHSGDAV